MQLHFPCSITQNILEILDLYQSLSKAFSENPCIYAHCNTFHNKTKPQCHFSAILCSSNYDLLMTHKLQQDHLTSSKLYTSSY